MAQQQARVLVIDEERAVRDATVAALRDAGYVAEPCASAASARRAAAALRPDLVILEMVYEGQVLGPCLAARLASEGDPLLFFVTSHLSAVDRLATFAAGADDYVAKPLSTDEMLARVHAMLRRADRLTSVVTQVGRMLVDERAHRVVFAGREVALSPTDFSLLATLARHAGHVLSKSRLLELVWGYEAVDESLVEVHICTMRRRLGRDGARVVQTVRGVGYVLRDDEPDLQPGSRQGE